MSSALLGRTKASGSINLMQAPLLNMLLLGLTREWHLACVVPARRREFPFWLTLPRDPRSPSWLSCRCGDGAGALNGPIPQHCGADNGYAIHWAWHASSMTSSPRRPPHLPPIRRRMTRA